MKNLPPQRGFAVVEAARPGCLALAEAEDHESLFSKSHGKAGTVAGVRDQTESVEVSGVEQVHRINGERAVCRVLPSRIGELLNGLNRILLEDFLPCRICLRGEISENALDRGFTESSNFSEQPFDHGCLCIVCIDEYGQSQRLVVGFEPLQWAPCSQDRISGCCRSPIEDHTGVADRGPGRPAVLLQRVQDLYLLSPDKSIANICGVRSRHENWLL